MIELDNLAMAREECIRVNAMLEQEQRENSGVDDQLMEKQQTSWAVDKICMGSFKIDMCFSYGDKDGLQWYQGTDVRVMKEENNFVIVEIKWDKECLREGSREITQDKLMRSKWISNEHQQGTWWENLHHMVQTAENL